MRSAQLLKHSTGSRRRHVEKKLLFMLGLLAIAIAPYAALANSCDFNLDWANITNAMLHVGTGALVSAQCFLAAGEWEQAGRSYSVAAQMVKIYSKRQTADGSCASWTPSSLPKQSLIWPTARGVQSSWARTIAVNV